MRQLSLFDSPGTASAAPLADANRMRRHVLGVLNTLRGASRLPWKPAEARKQEAEFAGYATMLPPGEAEVVMAEFRRELERLRG